MDKKTRYLALVIVVILIAGTIVYLQSMKAGFNSDEPINNNNENNDQNNDQNDQIKNQTINVEGNNPTIRGDSRYKVDQAINSKKEATYKFSPELAGIAGYINADSSIKINDLKGKVVLIDFWTYSCINCIRTLPYLREWHSKYEDDGLVIIGIHTPEFEFEKEYDNVLEAAKKYSLEYSIVQDNDYKTWRAFGNRYWPRKYLIDIDGFIRYDHIGEGSYDETEKVIQELLRERMDRFGEEKKIDGAVVPSDTQGVDFGQIETPEIYFGKNFFRGNIAYPSDLSSEAAYNFSLPKIVKKDTVYLEGLWKIEDDYAELVSNSGHIVLGYNAKSVNIVASSDETAEVLVKVDTKKLTDDQKGSDVSIMNERSVAMVDEERLYNLVDWQYGPGLLEMDVKGKGFRIYTFTFG